MSAIQMGLLAFAFVMLENVLRSTQSKNVAANYTKAVFVTGGMMTLCDGVIMTIIAKGGLEMLPYTVTASALGWTFGVKIHDWVTEASRLRHAEERKERKRKKEMKRIDKAVRKALKKADDEMTAAITAQGV